VAGRLGAEQERPAQAQGRRQAEEARIHLLEPEAAGHRGLLRALELRIRQPALGPGAGAHPHGAPKSLLTGERMDIKWSGNWDDDLGGTYAKADLDPMLKSISDKVKLEFEQTFMFYLPRICE